MKITIVSTGRAHLLDCARELLHQGHDVTFYSYTTRSNVKKYGFPVRRFKSMLWFSAPCAIILRKCKIHWIHEIAFYMVRWLIDTYVSLTMKKCDVLICQSPYGYRSMKKAKKKFNAITILDSGSSNAHVIHERLTSIGHPGLSEMFIHTLEKQYYKADYIAVASDFVVDGYIKNGISPNKMFLNPYGVSLKNFHPTKYSGEYDVVVVGQWSKRKGHHIVTEALKGNHIRLLHVGGILDLPFPSDENFTHIDSVPETELVKYYQKAKIFLFPSVEDGFGLVLIQALACGLPIVCSKYCGGSTLKRVINDNEYIYIMKDLSCEELIIGINKYLKLETREERNYAFNKTSLFSWEAYGKRYDDFLKKIVDK